MAFAKKSKAEKQAAIQEHREARKNLERVSDQTREETPEFWEANRRVINAEKNIPWWRR